MTKNIKLTCILTAVIIIVLDQITKLFFIDLLSNPTDPTEIIQVTSFFNFVMVWNTGVSFGLFADNADLGRWILTIVALCIVTGLWFWLMRVQNKYIAIAIGFIIGGALGNVIDRIRLGAVADFLDFHVNTYHWPAFNLADSMIFIGVIILLFEELIINIGAKDE